MKIKTAKQMYILSQKRAFKKLRKVAKSGAIGVFWNKIFLPEHDSLEGFLIQHELLKKGYSLKSELNDKNQKDCLIEWIPVEE